MMPLVTAVDWVVYMYRGFKALAAAIVNVTYGAEVRTLVLAIAVVQLISYGFGIMRRGADMGEIAWLLVRKFLVPYAVIIGILSMPTFRQGLMEAYHTETFRAAREVLSSLPTISFGRNGSVSVNPGDAGRYLGGDGVGSLVEGVVRNAIFHEDVQGANEETRKNFFATMSNFIKHTPSFWFEYMVTKLAIFVVAVYLELVIIGRLIAALGLVGFGGIAIAAGASRATSHVLDRYIALLLQIWLAIFGIALSMGLLSVALSGYVRALSAAYGNQPLITTLMGWVMETVIPGGALSNSGISVGRAIVMVIGSFMLVRVFSEYIGKLIPDDMFRGARNWLFGD